MHGYTKLIKKYGICNACMVRIRTGDSGKLEESEPEDSEPELRLCSDKHLIEKRNQRSLIPP